MTRVRSCSGWWTEDSIAGRHPFIYREASRKSISDPDVNSGKTDEVGAEL